MVPDATPPSPLPGARLLFSLDPSVTHLNHGSFGAVPIGVQRAQQRLRDEVEANPVRFMARGLSDRIAHEDDQFGVWQIGRDARSGRAGLLPPRA